MVVYDLSICYNVPPKLRYFILSDPSNFISVTMIRSSWDLIHPYLNVLDLDFIDFIPKLERHSNYHFNSNFHSHFKIWIRIIPLLENLVEPSFVFWLKVYPTHLFIEWVHLLLLLFNQVRLIDLLEGEIYLNHLIRCLILNFIFLI